VSTECSLILIRVESLRLMINKKILKCMLCFKKIHPLVEQRPFAPSRLKDGILPSRFTGLKFHRLYTDLYFVGAQAML